MKEFNFEVGEVTFEDGANVSQGCKDEVGEGMVNGVYEIYDAIWSGDIESLATMPVESFLPLIGIRHVGGFAMEQKISSESIEFGFDPEMVFERVRPTPKNKPKMLKAIDSQFSTQTDGEDPVMVSFILDENAINSFLLEFVLVERAFSLREFIKVDPRL